LKVNSLLTWQILHAGHGAGFMQRFLRNFYEPMRTFFPIFTSWKICFPHRFDRRNLMDIVFVAASAGLWGLMVLMVWGFKKLEKPQGGRP
jgi:hypothetical protein